MSFELPCLGISTTTTTLSEGTQGWDIRSPVTTNNARRGRTNSGVYFLGRLLFCFGSHSFTGTFSLFSDHSLGLQRVVEVVPVVSRDGTKSLALLGSQLGVASRLGPEFPLLPPALLVLGRGRIG